MRFVEQRATRDTDEVVFRALCKFGDGTTDTHLNSRRLVAPP